MKISHKFHIIILGLIFFLSQSINCQVTIGSHEPPLPGALLELKQKGTTSKGLGLPRVALKSSTQLLPCADETIDGNATKHIGLLIYNVETVADICPGLYVWNGDLWSRLYDSCPDNPDPLSISFDIPFLSIYNGSNKTLVPTITNDDGVSRTYTWISDSPGIATVDANGKVTSVAEGTAIINVKSGDGVLEANCKVFVTNPSMQYKYRIHLADKAGVSTDPTTFLSAKAIKRRERQGIPIDDTDYPISKQYTKVLQDKGASIVSHSKWMNTVAIHVTGSAMINEISTLPFVKNVELVWRGAPSEDLIKNRVQSLPKGANDQIYFVDNPYKFSWQNINISKGQILHDKGYRGEGIEIAVLDGGFQNINTVLQDYANIKELKAFDSKRTDLDFIVGQEASSHGTEVFSVMGTNKYGHFIGTAPAASYRLYLIGENDGAFRGDGYPITEDQWVAAAEYADSIGVDMINSSLGYNLWGQGVDDYTNAVTDGKTSHASIGASYAAIKGIFLTIAGGNSGSGSDGFVTPPADSPHVLAVGSIGLDLTISDFSSRNITPDGRTKPDVVALGGSALTVDLSGRFSYTSGTSFSSPIMCGLAACLWGAYPNLTSKELLQIIKESSENYPNPIYAYGHGRPDWDKALEKAKTISDSKPSNLPIFNYMKFDDTNYIVEPNQELTVSPFYSNSMVAAKNYTISADKSDILNVSLNADNTINVKGLTIGSAVVKIKSTDDEIFGIFNVEVRRPNDGIVRILAIGEQNVEDTFNEELHEMTKASGKKVFIARLTQKNATLSTHLSNINNNNSVYTYWELDENGNKITLESQNITHHLETKQWDHIIIQPEGTNPSSIMDYYPLADLHKAIKIKNINKLTKFHVYQNWAYSKSVLGSSSAQKNMYTTILNAIHFANTSTNFDLFKVPIGMTIQNMQGSSLEDNLLVNGIRLNNAAGRYAAACTVYEAILGNVLSNSYKPTSLSDSEVLMIKEAANAAALKNSDSQIPVR